MQFYVYDLRLGTYIRDLGNALKGGPGIAVDINGNIYITDFAQDSLYVYSPDYTLMNSYLVGDGPISVAVHSDLQSGVQVEPELQNLSNLTLYPNYPNPFNPRTSISYHLHQTTHVNLTVFDSRGRKIVELVDENQPSGHYHKFWDAGNVAGGIYFYRLRTSEGHTMTKKMVYLR